jgi:hypothetical protein
VSTTVSMARSGSSIRRPGQTPFLPTAPTTTPCRTGTSMALMRCSPAARNCATYVEDDVFVAAVQVEGSFSCDTQIGGSTTVPLLKVHKIALDCLRRRSPTAQVAGQVLRAAGRLGDPVDSAHRPVIVGE